VTKLDVILAAFERHGVKIDVEKLHSALADGDAEEEVREDEKLAQQLGISGVPFFLANGQVGMSGAQEPAQFERFLQVARERTVRA